MIQGQNTIPHFLHNLKKLLLSLVKELKTESEVSSANIYCWYNIVFFQWQLDEHLQSALPQYTDVIIQLYSYVFFCVSNCCELYIMQVCRDSSRLFRQFWSRTERFSPSLITQSPGGPTIPAPTSVLLFLIPSIHPLPFVCPDQTSESRVIESS